MVVHYIMHKQPTHTISETCVSAVLLLPSPSSSATELCCYSLLVPYRHQHYPRPCTRKKQQQQQHRVCVARKIFCTSNSGLANSSSGRRRSSTSSSSAIHHCTYNVQRNPIFHCPPPTNTTRSPAWLAVDDAVGETNFPVENPTISSSSPSFTSLPES